MTQWEYLFLMCEYIDGDWRPRYANGEDVSTFGPYWPTMNIYECCNLLGESGWEAISFITEDVRPTPGTEIFRMVFKRPKGRVA